MCDSCLSTKLLTLGIAHASTALHSLNRNSPLSLRAEEEKYTTCKEYVLMFLCLNILPFCRVCGHNTIVSLRKRISHTPQPVLRTYFYLALDNVGTW